MNRAPAADAAPFGVLLIGAPASGKGAQSGKIAKEYGLKRLSTGDLVRAAINAGTELGKQAKALMDEQSTVSDEILVQLAVDAIKSSTSGCGAATQSSTKAVDDEPLRTGGFWTASREHRNRPAPLRMPEPRRPRCC